MAAEPTSLPEWAQELSVPRGQEAERTMRPRTPAIRFANAMAEFQEEANAAFAEAQEFIACDHDNGLLLGDLIREHRNILGLSLEQLGQKAGCTKSHIWEIEDGRARNPTVKMVAGLAAALGLSTMLVFRAALRTADRQP
jgi:DNA-binding XRE family transcriptional regulator